MSKKNIVRKAIVFNLDDPLQKKMYDYIQQYPNFSYYGKTLVMDDMKKWEQNNKKKSFSDIEVKFGK